jgi:RNA polymerase sigma-70 factor (ECF subfamily)
VDRDAEAFATIYRTHHPAVLKFLSNRTRDTWLAEDIASETFVRAWKVIDRFESRDAGMVAWLQRIARNILYDHASAAYVRHERLSPYGAGEYDPTFDVANSDMDPGKLVAWVEDCATVARALDDQLWAILCLKTDDQRVAMLYRHIDGLSVTETAVKMGKHPGAVKALCVRGVANVARQMSGQSSLIIDR